jgi:putative aminopeptidase FrvX
VALKPDPNGAIAPELLVDLLAARGPAGAEAQAATVWRTAAASFAGVETDRVGNSIASIGADGPLLLLASHIDEIGLSVTHLDEHGFLRVRTIGGWQAEVGVGQRIVIAGSKGPVHGVVAREHEPPRGSEQRDEPGRARWRDVYVDIGARTQDEAAGRVRPGDPATIEGESMELSPGRIASRALDNRVGSYVVLDAARRLAENEPPPCRVAALAAVQEETAGLGARAAAFGLDPDVAIVVDVTDATDVPGADPKENGHRRLGFGPSITRGPVLTASVVDVLLETAEVEGIELAFDIPNWRTSTDADEIVGIRTGVPTGLVSVPIRHVHTPVEVVDLADVEGAVRLIVAFAARMPELA